MKKSLILLAAMAAVLSAACTKTETKEVEVVKEVVKTVDLLSLSATQLQVSNAGVVQPMSFVTEESWTISSDVQWISFDKASGSAGSSSVNMTVAENKDYNARSGKVTLSSSSKNIVFTVVQAELSAFGSSILYKIDYQKQDITINVSSNVSYDVAIVDGDWLTVTQTKAAPVEGTIIVTAAQNDDLTPRTGSFVVTAGSTVQTYVVYQNSEYASASVASALYLGNSQKMYDDESYTYTTIKEFALEFSTSEGDVTLVINKGANLADVTTFPTGIYTIDETSSYADGTFSVKTGNEKYYTKVVSGGTELYFIDGKIDITADAGIYSVSANLVDAAGVAHMYSYQGELAVEDKSFGAEVYNTYGYNTYYTYFTTKANEQDITFRMNQAPAEGVEELMYLSVVLFGPASGDPLTVAEGKYTYNVPSANEEIDSANGVLQAPEFSFYISSARAVDYNKYEYAVKEGTSPELEIVSKGNNRYDVKVNATFTRKEAVLDEDGYKTYDDDWNTIYVEGSETDVTYAATFEDIYIAISDTGYKAAPDGSAEFAGVIFNNLFMPFYFGDNFDTGCHTFRFGFQGVDGIYQIRMVINVKDDSWTFTPTLRNRYDRAEYIPVGTYKFSATPAENTLLPVANYHHVINAYTGHAYSVVGGSITLASDSITYDLVAKYKSEEYTFKGSHPIAFSYVDGGTNGSYAKVKLALDEI